LAEQKKNIGRQIRPYGELVWVC
jgi:hypothetical protein